MIMKYLDPESYDSNIPKGPCSYIVCVYIYIYICIWFRVWGWGFGIRVSGFGFRMRICSIYVGPNVVISEPHWAPSIYYIATWTFRVCIQQGDHGEELTLEGTKQLRKAQVI